MTASVKQEPMDAHSVIDPIDLEEKILELCASYPDGIADAELQQKVPPNIDAKQRAAALNRLLAKSKIDLLKSGTMLLYKVKSSAESTQIIGASNEETLVYRVIEESKHKGIWIRDIRNSTNLPQAMLNKVLKTLESRKLVKSVKSVGAARKKMYMLFELEPDADVTGGVFYSEQEFDMQFVDLLNQQCLKYLRARAEAAQENYPDLVLRRKASYVASTEVWKHINELKISKINLSIGDIEKILDTVVYDGLADKEMASTNQPASARGVGGSMYSARPVSTNRCGLTKVPCAYCPLFNDCRPQGIVSPATCAYFKEWLCDNDSA